MTAFRQMKQKTLRDAQAAEPESLIRSPIHLLHRAGQCAADVFAAEMADLDRNQAISQELLELAVPVR